MPEKFSTDSAKKLTDLIKADDHHAFRQAFELFHKKVYGYFLKKTSSQFLADELTQKTFIKLWKSRSSLKTEVLLDRQFFCIAKSVLIDHYRSVAAENKNAENFKTLYNHPVAVFPAEAHARLTRLLSSLPIMRRKVFTLNRIEGYTYKEISAMLSLSVKTVEKHISLAIRQLGINKRQS